MTEHKGLYGLDEPLDVAERLIDEQAKCAIALRQLAEIRKILDGVNSPDWPANAEMMIELLCATVYEVNNDRDP